MSRQVSDYQQLVPSQNRWQPNFIAELAALLQPLVDCQAVMLGMPKAYDLDAAVGTQLDAVGLWVGVGRSVHIAFSVYFTWGDDALGWGAGRWKGPYDDTTTTLTLDDDNYRLLLRGRIAANRWDGTMAGAQAAYAYVFNNPNTRVFVQDNQNLTFSLNVAGQALDPVASALLTGGYLPIKPYGIAFAGLNTVTVPGAALFGWGNSNSLVAGWGIGVWAGSAGAPTGTSKTALWDDAQWDVDTWGP